MDIFLEILGFYFLFFFGLFIATWLAFVIVMKYKGELRDIKALPVKLYWLVPVGVLGWIGDVLWNVFCATPLFMQLPDIYRGMRAHDITLSHRLRQILRGDTLIHEGMLRWHFADILCKYFIEPYDCKHCGRNDK